MGFWHRVKERMKTRGPWFAAVLNFFGWGLGYLYAGRKKLVGLALFFLVGGGYAASVGRASGAIGHGAYLAIILFAWLFVAFALARDAYLEAKERNEEATDGG